MNKDKGSLEAAVQLPVCMSIGMTLAYMAQLTPISGGYFAGVLMLAWMTLRRKHWPAPTERLREREIKFRAKLAPLNSGIGLFAGLHAISAVASYFTSDYHPSLREILMTTWHLVGKWLLLWLVISQSFAVVVRLGWQPRMVVKHLSIWIMCYFIYCLAQRTWGLDWARGFDRYLGANRLAYGVFRVSGLMSHPLTLTYNLMLILFTATALASGKSLSWERTYQKIFYSWGFIAVMTLTLLLISGSRFVLLLIPPIFLIAYASQGRALFQSLRTLLKNDRRLSLGLFISTTFSLVIMIGLLGHSTWSRFAELFDPSIPWDVRWPRLVYWKIHGQLFLDHPFFGVSVAKVSVAAKNSILMAGNPLEIMNAHNMPLQTLADSGIIGLLGLLALYLSILKAGRSPLLDRVSQRGFSMILLALLGSSLAQNVLRDSEFVFCLWISLGSLLAFMEEEDESLPYARQPHPFHGPSEPAGLDQSPAAPGRERSPDGR